MTFRLRDLRIALRLGLLGFVMLVATAVVGFGGWQGLERTHELQIRATHTATAFAAAVDTARVAQVDFKKQVQSWKDTLLRGATPEAFKKYHDQFGTSSQAVDRDLASLKQQMTALGLDSRGVDAALSTHAELQKRYEDALQKYNGSKPESVHVVDALVAGMDRPPTDAIDALVAGMKDQAAAEGRSIDAESEDAYRGAWHLLAAVVFCALVACTLLIWLLAYSITMPIHRAVKMAEAVADGDLRTRIESASRDETGQLLAALDRMNRQLLQVVGTIRKGSHEISSSTNQIASGNHDLSSRTSEQAAALEETAASMQEFTESVNANAMRAQQAAQLAAGASNVARESGAAMSEAVKAMERVQDVSGRINEITETMAKIATQTHILAINASVEAAHAGEAGKGFNVVASEVQSLARSSRAASDQIRALIEESISIIDGSTQRIGHAEAMVGKLLGSVDEVVDTVNSIALQSREQATGIQQVNQAVSQMDEVTQSNAALVEEAAAAAEAVQLRAGSLVRSVAFFKVDEEEELAEAA
ncbi:methyl-accepting chemotaxis protein [Rhodanobacter hydrolyticus]|uniref:HAMP domain-containing protein n=1 Tax=Rhodanobacter hydrolyticus TaxID=2250595 RepID=A0ABW8J7J4_9GAMM